jgi:ATP-binding cassette subfamily C (CFTR/MRP) protein 1
MRRLDLPILVYSILNLFSKDINVVDEVLARVFSGFFRSEFTLKFRSLVQLPNAPWSTALAAVLAILLVMGISIPLSLLAVIPLAFIYYRIMQYVRTTGTRT